MQVLTNSFVFVLLNSGLGINGIFLEGVDHAILFWLFKQNIGTSCFVSHGMQDEAAQSLSKLCLEFPDICIGKSWVFWNYAYLVY